MTDRRLVQALVGTIIVLILVAVIALLAPFSNTVAADCLNARIITAGSGARALIVISVARIRGTGAR